MGRLTSHAASHRIGVMKHTARTGIAVLFFTLLSGAAWGAGTFLTIKGGYFLPFDDVFKDVYGSSLSFGAETSIPLSGPLHAWAGVELFSRSGLTTISEEPTKVRIVPLYAGLRALFGKKTVRPYIGAAAAYFLFHEENPLGTVSDSGLGFLAQAGVMARLAGPLWLDAFAGFRACTLRTDGEDPLEAKLGGLSVGLGLAYRF